MPHRAGQRYRADDQGLQGGQPHEEAAQPDPVDDRSGQRAQHGAGQIGQRQQRGRPERPRAEVRHGQQGQCESGDLPPDGAGDLLAAQQHEGTVATQGDGPVGQ